MRQPDRGIRLVDVLAAGPLRTERVHADLVPVELDLDIVVDLGQDLDQGECRVPPLLGVERADPHEPVNASLRAEPAVGTPAVDRDRRALDARLLALELIDDLGLVAVSLGPTQIHPSQHLGPIGCLCAAGPGADREQCAAFVELAGEEEQGPLPLEVALEGRGLAVELGGQLGIARFLDELEGGQEIVRPSVEVTPQTDVGAKTVGLAQDLLRGTLVVPETRGGCLRVQLGDAPFPGV
jgi:hypothetical protein